MKMKLIVNSISVSILTVLFATSVSAGPDPFFNWPGPNVKHFIINKATLETYCQRQYHLSYNPRQNGCDTGSSFYKITQSDYSKICKVVYGRAFGYFQQGQRSVCYQNRRLM